MYGSGVVIVREKNTEAVKTCTVRYYDTFEEYADNNVSASDIVYVYDAENKIRADTLKDLLTFT